jgi:hypothetical protein
MKSHFSFAKAALGLICVVAVLNLGLSQAQAQGRRAQSFRCDPNDAQNAVSDTKARFKDRQQAQAACAGRVLPYFTAKAPAKAQAGKSKKTTKMAKAKKSNSLAR